ncbi:beta-ketoacyl-[acyl-carrier-protein] synthase family protein [Marinactinospora thermotolerans]|uniref:Act minimal PKS ketosynthase (KS/KS alpha) n=1 Tax=Marinactinospora thermotolerans DSM 45154 TaxID=1122192 RepID=A0A1T4NC71_9ACTN|nr:beta-ketoacyl-[acyl-carrier-protein] synthase family protein [Marinactinospora thermotolerans]SJZ76666.1 act minimal PKS ketosynthase (KS/KS alpha) [Marinactinospora thermotolerans DSM 45154]
MRRVAITGLGVLAPNGTGVKEYARALWEGQGAISRITAFDPSGHHSRIAGQVDHPSLPSGAAEDPDGEDRVVRMAQIAADEALASAGLPDPRVSPDRIGVAVSNAIGGIFMTEHFADITAGGTGPIDVRAAHPQLHRAATFATPGSVIADAYGFEGVCATLTTGCTGGNDAIGFALDAIRRGDADVMLAGGAEAPVSPFVVACFDVIGALSVRNDDPEHASRPFERDRDGFVLAEGAGLAVLEEWEHARARGATVLGEVLGYGSVNNAFHMTDLDFDGADLARSFRLALEDARCGPERVGYINAHGSSTPQNDVCETNAIKSVLGAHARTTPVSSTKSMVGHALAAANALEFVASALALRDGVLPPTINLFEADRYCDLDYVPNTAREADPGVIASLSSGFGGIHSTVVLGAV